MALLFPLEDFSQPAEQQPGAGSTAAEPPAPTPEQVENQRMAAYEQGYQAGWDDATRAESQEQSRIRADFARNLQDLGFTYHEARSHVMRAMEPLLNEIVSKVLPSVIAETLGQTILEELIPMVEQASDTPIEVVINPGNRAMLETLITDSVSVPISIVEEESLADGQVYLRMDNIEKQIDMNNVLDRIGSAIGSVYEINKKAS
ncbi:flagellar biosynthesis protein [Candidatus Halocynthiibacter alkanivorans]|uniref:FliH/SctL family protein n=1 Tax=Candidatus Halocynthiibacter alkanivorans TaxID=2267619 RepID=UPI000DF42095|nr:flagellar biosynthesis protein [Candidatus Halocynthiibacter alkanivorans]